MEPILLCRISFGSFTKILVLVFALAGLCCGTLLLLLGFVGANVYVRFNDNYVRGPVAGAIALAMLPILFSLGATVLSIATYLPFQFFLRMTNGIYLNGIWQNDLRPGVLSPIAEKKNL